MRRSSAGVVLALSLLVSVTTTSVAVADDERATPTSGLAPHAADAGVEHAAEQALEQAAAAVAGTTGTTGRGTKDSPTLALRDLFVALPSLEGDDRTRAQALLGRPTQRANDPNGDGYTTKSKRTCTRRICLHWVPTTEDAPPNRAWVDTTMAEMKRTWEREVKRLGYRRPLRDGDRGGDNRFDVYLKDVGSEGYYGYCAPEQTKPGRPWLASGYCVLDDDFARAQFGTKPRKSLRVTAAHEFFHAIQFAYDYGEDRWLMESTATWIEERVADRLNDNRQYLRHGQVNEPADPLDLFNPAGFDQYGNWVFFEFLSERYGNGIVRRAWENAATYGEAPDDYSTRAVQHALPRSTTWTETFRAYAAANTAPADSYAEGAHWPSAASARVHTLSGADPGAGATLRIDHLASKNVTVQAGDGLRSRSWRLRVRIDGPRRKTSPAAYLLVRKNDGSLARKPIDLDRSGAGSRVLKFSSRTVQKVTLTLANASTRSNCWEQDTTYACQGIPRDDGKRFTYAVEAFRR